MIEIDETLFGFDNRSPWLKTDAHIDDVYCILAQLYAQMMGWV